MKVNGVKPPDNQGIGPGSPRVRRLENKDSATSDRVQISVRAKEIARLKALIVELPEVRQDKVDAARDAIKAGIYRVDSNRIARRLMNEQ